MVLIHSRGRLYFGSIYERSELHFVPSTEKLYFAADKRGFLETMGYIKLVEGFIGGKSLYSMLL
jgi:hypothetical protein